MHLLIVLILFLVLLPVPHIPSTLDAILQGADLEAAEALSAQNGPASIYGYVYLYPIFIYGCVLPILFPSTGMPSSYYLHIVSFSLFFAQRTFFSPFLYVHQR